MLSREKMAAGGALVGSFGAGLALGGPQVAAALSAAAVLLAVLVAAAWFAVAHRRGRRDAARAAAELARRRALDEFGAALLRPATTTDVYRLAGPAAAAIVAGIPGASATLFASPNPDDGAALPVAARPVEMLSGDVRAALTAGDVMSGTNVTLLGAPGSAADDHAGPARSEPTPRRRDADTRTADRHRADDSSADRADRPGMLLPLTAGGRLFGVLHVDADQPLPAGTVAALESLRVQTSLALRAAALTGELTLRATRDALTGLGNRALLRDTVTSALARARRSGRPVGVLLLDVNRFRRINDVHGHETGDELLKLIADRLRAAVRTEDTVGRLDADRFAVVAEDLRAAQDVVLIAERILLALDRSLAVGGRVLRASASAGIALSHAGTHGADELLRDAEAAMSAAKQSGDGRYHLHGAVLARS